MGDLLTKDSRKPCGLGLSESERQAHYGPLIRTVLASWTLPMVSKGTTNTVP